jgi:cytosine/creatinine deaminase
LESTRIDQKAHIVLDLLIKNAKLRGKEGTYNVAVESGKITNITKDQIAAKAEETIDASENLLTPAFVNTHVHLDKCLTGEWIRTTADATTGSTDVIPAATMVKKRFTEEDIRKRAGRAIELSVARGCTFIRAFADVDTIGGLTAVKGLMQAKKDYSEIAELQVVAFPQEGILRDLGTEELLYKAMELGADLVGGIPWYELTNEDSVRHTNIVFEIAKKFDKDIHMLIDDTEDPAARNIEYFLVKTLRENYNGRVSAVHCRGALDSPNDTYARKIVGLAKKAQMTIVENPHISLMMYGRNDKFPIRRGITRVREFMKAGVNVATGQDDIDDPYYPFGRGDMLELAYFMCHSAYLGSPSEFEAAYDIITFNGAKAMRLPNYGIEPGCFADLIILDAKSVHEALRMQSERLYVIRKGKVVAKNKIERELIML